MTPFKPTTLAGRRSRRAAARAPETGSPRSPLTFPVRPRRPGPAPGVDRAASKHLPPTRDSIYEAAATAFATHGFDGVAMEDVAGAAGVNKAMIYYHFKGKHELYREIVRDMLRAMRAALVAIVDGPEPAAAKIDRFIQVASRLREARPWFPPMMLREMSAGGPRLDAETLAQMKGVFLAFSAILDAGVASNEFRRVNPVLAYVTILGPMMMNAVRERAAAEPGRKHLPMFVPVDWRELEAHMQDTARRMLAKERR